jgi:glycosyltransferase involved in cell wall biosynthesis
MGGNNEIINEKNNCGILVRYGDTHAISSAIQSLRTNGALATEMKKNALLTIERDFSVGVMLKKTYDSFA